jgi:hypothetical protein
MELLFLNESATLDTPDMELEKFAESTYGVSVADNKDMTLEEVMIEATEELHEAEMTAMQEEFKVFKESADGILNEEGTLKKVGDTIKEWWKKLVAWLTKIWNKIVHYFWQFLNWCRKTAQTVISKFTGRKNIYVPKALEAAKATFTNLSADAGNVVSECENYIEHGASKIDLSQVKAKFAKGLDKASTKTKDAVKKDLEKGNFNITTLEQWKKMVDDSLKDYEKTKAIIEKAKATITKRIKDNDAKIERLAKSGSESDKKDAVTQANKLKAVSALLAKKTSRMISDGRWYMSALFTKCRSSNGDKKLEVHT